MHIHFYYASSKFIWPQGEIPSLSFSREFTVLHSNTGCHHTVAMSDSSRDSMFEQFKALPVSYSSYISNVRGNCTVSEIAFS